MTDSGGKPFFSEKHDSFESAFPDIDDIEVQIEETDLVETQKTRYYTLDTIPGKEPCTNVQCTNKGIRLDRLVSQMTHDGETYKEFSEGCNGVEKIGQNKTRTCPHRFKIEINIEYQ